MPSRSESLRQKVKIFVLCYIVLDLAGFGAQPEKNPILYAPGRVRFLGNQSGEQLLVRLTTTLGFWVSLYASAQMYSSIVPFLGVACGLIKVESWPPTFGPIKEAYTIRQFWGCVSNVS